MPGANGQEGSRAAKLHKSRGLPCHNEIESRAVLGKIDENSHENGIHKLDGINSFTSKVPDTFYIE